MPRENANSTNANAARAGRPYDVIVWGATGFTGRLVAEYLAKHYGMGRDLKWAIAGRNREKLAQVRDALVAIDPATRDLPLLVGDGRDAASLAPIVSSTRVIATTVGPYAVYGHELVAACVEHGTDSVDLTGEPQFVRTTIDRHHARAKETGARIVNCCGFDSIPSDLGVLLLQTEMQARHGAHCAEVKFFLAKMRGGFSGGTAASALHMAEEIGRDPSLRRLVGNPYALDPDRDERGPDGQDQRGVRWDDDLKCWTAPFVMAAINTRVVRRSNALFDYRYGKDFRYSECTAFSAGPGGLLKATAMTAGFAAFFVAAALPPTRALLGRALPAPGEGPSKEARDAGFFVAKPRRDRREIGRPRSRSASRDRAGAERSRVRRDCEDVLRVRRAASPATTSRRRGGCPHSGDVHGHAPRGALASRGDGLRRGADGRCRLAVARPCAVARPDCPKKNAESWESTPRLAARRTMESS